MKVKLLEPIEGFEDVAEYRVPQEQERFVRDDRAVYRAFSKHPRLELVLTPIKRWRPATIDDAVRAIKGDRVVARFWDSQDSEWLQGFLAGFRDGVDCKWLTRCNEYSKCEVLDA